MKRKIFQGILALVIACGLWVYVITVDNPNDEVTIYDVPVALSGETFLHERGLMLDSQEMPTITLTLSGNRSDLKKVNKSNIAVVVDLSKIADSGKQALNYDIIFPGDVPDNAIKVESRLPDRVSVNVEGRTQKDLEVKVAYTGKVREGFIADKNSLELSHKYITVSGPTAILDQIGHIQVTVDLEDRAESISQKLAYSFCDTAGNPIDEEKVDVSRVEAKVSEVELSMKILRLKEVQLIVEVIYGGGATKENTKIEQDIQVIEISGSEQLLEGLDELKIGTIDLSQEKDDVLKQFSIELPEGVNNVTGVTEVNVTVDFEGLVTKSLTVSAIEGINIPKGMKVDIKTKNLQVTLRGSADQLNKLTAEDVTIRVDFTNAEVGAATYQASIYVGDRIIGVGALGSYSVSASVTEGTP